MDINIDSIIEIHDLPFAVINREFKIVTVNSAYENHFGIEKKDIIGKNCCTKETPCRHHEAFIKLQPYTDSITLTQGEEKISYTIRGYPLLNNTKEFYVGESYIPNKNNGATSDKVRLIGQSPAFTQFKTKLREASGNNFSVLLLGETGTGKELAAEFIHTHSSLKDQNYVIADSTVITDELFESELFGHEKGAFTGAVSTKQGLFEVANNGTIFLDEIGELPLSMQPKLLRVLENGQYKRVGGTKLHSTNARIICATHRNLPAMILTGEFRQDLFYRLSILPIHIPPLRNRLDDIPLLVNHFLNRMAVNTILKITITQKAIEKLQSYSWPGNIRELKNCLYLASLNSKDRIIDDFNIEFLQRPELPTVAEQSTQQTTNTTSFVKCEIDFINSLISKYQGNRRLIAQEMNISERTLYRKLVKFNLN